MPFNHRQYNANFVQRAKTGSSPVTPDPMYQVSLVPANVAPGESYWKVVGIHHLLPDENMSNHNVYLEALDEQGNRVRPPIWAGWTWEGRRPQERADPVPLDKPDNEAGGNISLFSAQNASVWIKGGNPGANDKSDRVDNLHIRHADEPLPDGRKLNTYGHHSFYVVFQRTLAPQPLQPSQPPVVQPVQPSQPPVQPSQPPVVQPSQPPVQPVQPPQPPVVPPVQPSQPPVQPSQPPVVQPSQPSSSTKPINYYILLGPLNSRGRQTNLLLATAYILAFSATVGFSVEEAKQARQVTIIGEGISPADQQAIRNAGSQVEVLTGDPYEIEAKLTARLRSGRGFGG